MLPTRTPTDCTCIIRKINHWASQFSYTLLYTPSTPLNSTCHKLWHSDNHNCDTQTTQGIHSLSLHLKQKLAGFRNLSKTSTTLPSSGYKDSEEHRAGHSSPPRQKTRHWHARLSLKSNIKTQDCTHTTKHLFVLTLPWPLALYSHYGSCDLMPQEPFGCRHWLLAPHTPTPYTLASYMHLKQYLYHST